MQGFLQNVHIFASIVSAGILSRGLAPQAIHQVQHKQKIHAVVDALKIKDRCIAQTK